MKPKFARLYLQTRVSGGKVSHNLASFAISSRDHCGREAEERASRVCCLFSGFNKKFFVGIVVELISSLTVYNTLRKELPIGWETNILTKLLYDELRCVFVIVEPHFEKFHQNKRE